MNLHEVYEKYGKEIGDLAVSRAEEWAKENPDDEYAKRYKKDGLNCSLDWAFDWMMKTHKECCFWGSMDCVESLQFLKENYPEMFPIKQDTFIKDWIKENGMENAQEDSIVKSVVEQFNSRSKTGIDKYGVTLDRSDLKPLEWLQHLQEELMDATLYIEKLKKELGTIQ